MLMALGDAGCCYAQHTAVLLAQIGRMVVGRRVPNVTRYKLWRLHSFISAEYIWEKLHGISSC